VKVQTDFDPPYQDEIRGATKVNQVLLDSALVTCTRNRPDRLRELLTRLQVIRAVPRLVVVVDSSELPDTREIVDSLRGKTDFELKYVKSLYGAAHQKNMGFEYVCSKFAPHELTAIHFLDDDINPSDSYFEKCVSLFKKIPTAVVIGGFDISLTPPRPSLMRDIFFLGRGIQTGIALPSGICIVPFPRQELEKVTWVPGGMQNFNFETCYYERFDGRVRIYGDEVEMQLRLAKLGDIYCSNDLSVRHYSETIAKDSQRIEQSYMDGFRWILTRRYPQRFNKAFALWSTLGLICGELIRSIQRGDKLAFTRLQGHFDFFGRLLTKKPLQQYVSHAASGPFTEAIRD